MMTEEQLIVKMEKEMPDSKRAGMMQALLQLEQRMGQTQSKPLYREVSAEVTKLYETLDRILAKTVKALGYSPKMRQWDDTRPLDLMVRLFPELQQSQWYKLKMSYILAAD